MTCITLVTTVIFENHINDSALCAVGTFMLQVCVHTVTIANIITCVPSWEKCQRSTRRLLEITIDYWRLLEITVDYWRLLEITAGYWRLLEITGD